MDKTAKKSSQRSPGYPAIDLKTAISKTEELYRKINKGWVHYDAMLESLGYTTTSGAGRVALAAMRKYGLIEYKGSKNELKAKLTDRALDIILDEREDSQIRKDAIKKAALSPDIFSEIYNMYEGNLPDDKGLSYVLIREKDFSDSGAKKFIEQFRATIDFAELKKDANISQEEEVSNESPNDLGRPNKQTSGLLPKGLIMNVLSENKGQDTNEIIDFPIPLSLKSAVIIRSAFPMSEDDWELMTSLLESYRNRLVEGQRFVTKATGDKPSIDEEPDIDD